MSNAEYRWDNILAPLIFVHLAVVKVDILADSVANSLISETIEQIDKLGSELDFYCKTAPSVMFTQQTIRFRSGYFFSLFFISQISFICYLDI